MMWWILLILVLIVLFVIPKKSLYEVLVREKDAKCPVGYKELGSDLCERP